MNGKYEASTKKVLELQWAALQPKLYKFTVTHEEAIIIAEVIDISRSLFCLVESQLEQVGDLKGRLALYIRGACTCPEIAVDRKQAAQHFPGCPEIAKAEIARLNALVPKPVNVVRGKYGYTQPTTDRLFLAYCPEGGTEFFVTRDEAENRAHDFIQEWREDGWGEDVDKVFVAQIISRATQCDREDRPAETDEDGLDENGEYWDDDWEYKCNYKLMPLPPPPQTSKENV